MIDCARCATPNTPDARFCNNCGASLVARVETHERRFVTALFADLARSTALGEQLDPEVVRGMVGRFFELAAREVEARGGSVEKFSGDAVMAVFGLTVAHEDDPERAVRTALAIRDGVTAIAADTQQRHGVNLQARIGIEAGEVVVGDPFGGATMATGDAMNLAARLEQQAEPGDVVIGASVYEHVRDMVTAEPLGNLAIRGREGSVAGWRVEAVAKEVGRPRGVAGLEAPLTGRDEELTLLLDAARRSEQEGKAVLFTILGVPGVGKSRLVREATAHLAAGGWSVVRGRCLPYGEGITYWPVAEMVRELAGISAETSADQARAALAALSPDADVADRLGLALGLADPHQAAASSGIDREIAWGVRRLVEHLTAHRSLVLVFEDIHWADPPLLDLIEYLVTWARDTALMVICPARPELLDARPAWGAGRMESSRMQLEPLSAEESRSLLGALLAVDDLPAALRQRVLDRAEGNPLFVEEVVRMLIAEGVVEERDGHWYARAEAANVGVPDSVEALIRARLDTLPRPQRAMLQAASVVGRVFQQSAVATIAPDPAGGPLELHLEDAVLRDLITEERSPAEPTFRFRHILIRDVAYNSLPKARRADLHRGVAAWLRDWAGSRMDEFIEVEAYHLEQAVQLRVELDGRADAVERDRAVTALLASARIALARDDARAARTFADRALRLDPESSGLRLEIEDVLLDALRRLGEWRQAGDLGARLEGAAAAMGRLDIQGRAILAKAGDIWVSLDSANSHVALAELRRAKDLFTAARDDRYLVLTLEWLGYGGWWHGDLDAAEGPWTDGRAIARANGWASLEAEALVRLSMLAAHRGDHERRSALLAEARSLAEQGPSRLTLASVERAYGSFLATTSSDLEGEAMLHAAAGVLEEFGERQELHTALIHLGDIERGRDNPAAALVLYRRGLEQVLEHVGYRPEAQRRIAHALLELGELDEAAAQAEEAAAITGKDDWGTVASTGSVLGLVREAQGQVAEAERLLRDAVETISRTEFDSWFEDLSLAEFLLRAGRFEEGNEYLAKARASAERHGPRSVRLAQVERVGARAAAMGRTANTGR